jgi:phosphoribosylformimino-5-aminoimidazole carboxamide ribotide isomerase
VIVVPAIDLLDGKAVRLREGRYDQVTIFDLDPTARARAWRGRVPWLHVVDLEGARAGRPMQREMVLAIVDAFGPGVQIGGGVRTRESFEAYRRLGTSRIVLGSAAVKDGALVHQLAAAYPNEVVLAVDARAGLVATDGWTETTNVSPIELVRSFSDAPLGAILYTDVTRDGTRVGPNVEETARLARATDVPVIASGGVGTLDDLRALSARGIPACIVGRALYENAFTLDEALEAAQ